MSKEYKRYRFFVLIPLIILFAAGIGVRTLRRMVPFSASLTFNYSGQVEMDKTIGLYHGKTYKLPDEVFAMDSESNVLGLAKPTEKWIEVDLSDQKLFAWDGEKLFLETLISTGLPWWPTPTGEFRIWVKMRAANMEGGEGRYYYNLPNVPYVMYFSNDEIPSWRGFGLHGTYWHNDFGTVHSHGCVNLPTEIAGELYHWVTPVLSEGKTTVFATEENIGTKIIIHD